MNSVTFLGLAVQLQQYSQVAGNERLREGGIKPFPSCFGLPDHPCSGPSSFGEGTHWGQAYLQPPGNLLQCNLQSSPMSAHSQPGVCVCVDKLRLMSVSPQYLATGLHPGVVVAMTWCHTMHLGPVASSTQLPCPGSGYHPAHLNDLEFCQLGLIVHKEKLPQDNKGGKLKAVCSLTVTVSEQDLENRSPDPHSAMKASLNPSPSI